MSALRKSARGKPCTLRLSGCSPGPENEKVVLAHAPCPDLILAGKSPDWWAFYACHHCHDLADGRKATGPIDQLKMRGEVYRAVYETQRIMHEEGLLKVV